MSKKSCIAMTGLCVLMATSAAQAHLIPTHVEAYEAGAQVGGAFDSTGQAHSSWGWGVEGAGNRLGLTPAHTFNQVLGRQSSVAGVISRMPLQASNQARGKRGHSIVDGICDRLPPATKVPEPETLALLMAGLLGVAVTRRRRREPAATG